MKFTKINTLTGLINKIKSSLNKETIGLGNVDNISLLNYNRTINYVVYPYVKSTVITNGITYTDNGDGSITINGTATARAFFVINGNKPTNKSGKLYFIIDGSNGSNVKIEYKGSIYTANQVLNIENSHTGGFNIFIETNTSINNVKIYPIIVDDEHYINKDVYVPINVSITKANISALDAKLDKFEFEYNKHLSFGGNDHILCLGRYPCSDSLISMELDIWKMSSLPKTAKLEISTINYRSGRYGDFVVYNDATGEIADTIFIEKESDYKTLGVYIKLGGWGKISAHIKCTNIETPSQIFTEVGFIPTGATINPVNYLKDTFDTKADKSDFVENNESSSSGAFSQVGWYRIAKYTGTQNLDISKGSYTNSCEFILKRQYNAIANEYHHLYFSGVMNLYNFSSINNLSRNQLFTKCRYVVVNNQAWIEVFYNSATTNAAMILINNSKTYWMYWQAITPEFVGTDDITGQVVYDIPANSELAQKSDVYLDKTLLASDDLNNITDNAIYTMKTTPASGKNYPVQLPGTLFNTNDGSNYIRQMYIASTANDTRVYIRNRAKTSSTSYTWSSWVRLATTT